MTIKDAAATIKDAAATNRAVTSSPNPAQEAEPHGTTVSTPVQMLTYVVEPTLSMDVKQAVLFKLTSALMSSAAAGEDSTAKAAAPTINKILFIFSSFFLCRA